MKNNLKIAAVAVTLLLALGAVAFVFAMRQNNAALADAQNVNPAEMQTLVTMDNQTCPFNQTGPGGFYGPCPGRGHGMMGGGQGCGQFLSENATLATVEGTVVAQSRSILVLSTASGQVDVTIPRDWTVGSEAISGRDLFNGTFASSGQTVTLSVIENEMFSNANFSINSMLAYKATNATGTAAYAVLPFNIQPTG